MNLLTKFTTLQKKLILYFLDTTNISLSLIIASLLITYPVSLSSNKYIFLILMTIVVLKLSIFSMFKIYDYMWRYASKEEFIKVILCCIISTSIFFILNISLNKILKVTIISNRIIFIDMILNIILIVGLRALLKSIYQYLQEESVKNNKTRKKRVIIIGAGEAGNIIGREILRNQNSSWNIIGYIDDKKELIGRKINHKKILDTTKNLNKHIKENKIEELIIAMPSAKSKAIRNIIQIGNNNNITCKTTPNLSDLINQTLTLKKIRDVKIEDLLGRDPIKINTKLISNYINNKTILITGAGGSIGSEISRQIIQYKPNRIILLDHSENSIYLIDQELKHSCYENIELIPVVQDIKIKFLLEKTFYKYKPDIIFHAAAHKHVPLMECNVHEIIENNILGTKNLIELAHNFESEKFIFISTDKAVNPTNVMGATKRTCELLINYYAKKSKTIFSSVRFGNVLGSNGSVIPLFKKQIKKGGPITITHKDITRYFMTITEAVSLVIQTGSRSKGGEIFILDMGSPIKILDLAKDIITLSGYTESQIPIKFTKLRTGEKLYEELFYDKKNIIKTEFNKIFIGNELNFKNNINKILLEVEYILEQNKKINSNLIKEKIFNLIKKYVPEKNSKKTKQNENILV